MPRMPVESKPYHIPVLLQETADLLNVRPGGLYVDATLGGGGHAREFLRRSGPDGRLLGIDRDPQALAAAGSGLDEYGPRLVTRLGNFRDVAEIARSCGFGQADGALFDLGVSSAQIDRPERGFSFQEDGPLDMRMGEEGDPAREIVNRYDERVLSDIIFRYGEERGGRAIARAIVRRRSQRPIATTAELRVAVLSTRPRMPNKTLARVFQALRIEVNGELRALSAGLAGARDILKAGGRLAVICYHSLEDSVVKDFFRNCQHPCTCPPKMSVCSCGAVPSLRIINNRAERPGPEEKDSNPRARSAGLRVAEKI